MIGILIMHYGYPYFTFYLEGLFALMKVMSKITQACQPIATKGQTTHYSMLSQGKPLKLLGKICIINSKKIGTIAIMDE